MFAYKGTYPGFTIDSLFISLCECLPCNAYTYLEYTLFRNLWTGGYVQRIIYSGYMRPYGVVVLGQYQSFNLLSDMVSPNRSPIFILRNVSPCSVVIAAFVINHIIPTRNDIFIKDIHFNEAPIHLALILLKMCVITYRCTNLNWTMLLVFNTACSGTVSMCYKISSEFGCAVFLFCYTIFILAIYAYHFRILSLL